MTQKKQLGTVLFSNITEFPEFNGKKGDKYEITITLTAEQAADAEANGLSVTKGEYNGNEQFKAKFKTKYMPSPKACVDRYAKPFVDSDNQLREIPRGSTVDVVYTTKPYSMMGKSGITNYLVALQVVEENGAFSFEAYDDAPTFQAASEESGEETEY